MQERREAGRRESGLEGDRKGGIRNCMDPVLEGYRKRGIQDWRDSGLEGYGIGGKKKTRVQDRRDVEEERCRTGWIGKVGHRTAGMHDWRDAGKEGQE